MNFQILKLDLEKAEEPEIKLSTSTGSLKKHKSSIKTSISASMTMLKPLAVWNTNNRGKVLQGWEYQTTVTDRNGTDLTEAEDIKKRWQEYT